MNDKTSGGRVECPTCALDHNFICYALSLFILNRNNVISQEVIEELGLLV